MKNEWYWPDNRVTAGYVPAAGWGTVACEEYGRVAGHGKILDSFQAVFAALTTPPHLASLKCLAPKQLRQAI